MVSLKKNNTAADNVASLLIFYFILDYWLEDTALGGTNVDGSCNKICAGKVRAGEVAQHLFLWE